MLHKYGKYKTLKWLLFRNGKMHLHFHAWCKEKGISSDDGATPSFWCLHCISTNKMNLKNIVSFHSCLTLELFQIGTEVDTEGTVNILSKVGDRVWWWVWCRWVFACCREEMGYPLFYTGISFSINLKAQCIVPFEE